MIISHQHRYLFVELPRTGSTAIRRELRQHYGGQPILFKHATYQDFLRIATPEEREYFVFSCIRNPLDDAVSLFFKYKTNHEEQFARLSQPNKNRLVQFLKRQQFTFVHGRDADFSDFFLRHYWLPYSNWSSLSHASFDFVIRFERLAEDFSEALRQIGIEPVRPLPVTNATGKRKRDFATYYSDEAIQRARRVFGPYMKTWGYNFPAAWGEGEPSPRDEWLFQVCNQVRVFYWKHLRFRLYGRDALRRSQPA